MIKDIGTEKKKKTSPVPKGPISNEDIYKKLLQIESMLEKKVAERRFNQIAEWKMYIWDGCPHRVEKMGNNEIEFVCNLLNKMCEFSLCPRNRKK